MRSILDSVYNANLKAFTLLFLTGMSIPQALLAQSDKYEPYDVNDVSTVDFMVENDVIEENAEAVYLFELGDSNVKDNTTEWLLEFTHSFRVKILTEQGLDLADHIVQLYVGSNDEEKIGRVKGGVYNLVDGKVEFEKLKSSDWFVEDVNETTKIARMTFKNVKVGSIIDLTYTVFSPFIARMPDWEFQHDDIPVLYSEYYIRYPEMLGYKILQFGYHPLFASSHEVERDIKTGSGVSTAVAFKEVYVFACQNIPAMRDEPLMNSPENYRTKVITELNYVDYPNQPREFIYKDWVGAAKDFLEGGNIDQFMNPKNRLDYFTLSGSSCKDLSDSVRVIYERCRGSYAESDEINYIKPKRTPKEVLAGEKATANEINWILLSTLRANSIEAYPVLVSKRSGQRILKQYPIFTQFSGILTVVKSGDNLILLDASSPEFLPGEISQKYYNGDGLMLNADQPEWIPIVGSWPTTANCSIEFKSLEDGVLTGDMRLRVTGLYRTKLARAILDNNTDDFVKDLSVVKNAELTLNTEESDLNANPMDLRFDISLKLEKFGNSYLMPTVIYEEMENNILKDKDRRYPVNYIDNWSDNYTCLVHLENEKYDVTLPENANFILPDKDGKFTFMGSYNFGALVIRNKVEINKTTFLPAEYPALRQFYDLISTTHSSFIEITEK